MTSPRRGGIIVTGGMEMGKFVIRQVATGWKFNLKADNGEVIATSEVYDSQAACRKGLDSVRKAAKSEKVEDHTADGFKTLTNPKYESYQDRAGEYRFRLKARNGQIVAVSEGYTTHKACLDGVESVRKNAPDAEVVEE